MFWCILFIAFGALMVLLPEAIIRVRKLHTVEVMRTQEEIQQKLDFLRRTRSNFTEDWQLRQMDSEIARLEWVLGIGPDVVLVPRAKVTLQSPQLYGKSHGVL